MKVALVENYGADFVGARLRLALFLKRQGVNVTAIIPNDGCKKIIQNSEINVIEVGANIRAHGLDVKYQYAKNLREILVREEFDIVHFFRLQPNIIGTLIAGLFTESKIVNHVTGLGVAFSGSNLRSRIQQFVIKSIYKFNYLCFKPFTIFQNKQDVKELGFKKRAICIEGSAVNEDKFNSDVVSTYKENLNSISNEIEEKDKELKFIFVSRLLKEKGILELISGFTAAENVSHKRIKLIIVGWSDSQNPSAILPFELEQLVVDKPFIKYLGKRSDVDKLIYKSDVGILPTYYREGTPRFLLECMRMKKPIITTDMPGCDHLIDNNGLLIQPQSTEAIKNAILNITDMNLSDLGEKSFDLYNSNFSEKKVYSGILDSYKKLLN
ncbi:glycosyltransferase [Wenyingzhuangia sp. IMCC45533]